MNTARPLKGVDALRDATIQATPAIYVLIIDDIPRVLVTPKEAAAITRISYRKILDFIRDRRIKALGQGEDLRGYLIPVSEIAVVLSWADYKELKDTG